MRIISAVSLPVASMNTKFLRDAIVAAAAVAACNSPVVASTENDLQALVDTMGFVEAVEVPNQWAAAVEGVETQAALQRYCFSDCVADEVWHFVTKSLGPEDWRMHEHLDNLALYIDEGRVDDYNVLRSLPKKLKALSLQFSRITDITVLNGLEDLEYLHLDFSTVTAIPAGLHLPNLKVLTLSGTNLEDISGLASQENLVYLDMASSSKIRDITPLMNLKKLRYLNLGAWHNLENIDALSGLVALEELNLRSTSVRNFDAVRHLPKLKELHVDDVSNSTPTTIFQNVWDYVFGL